MRRGNAHTVVGLGEALWDMLPSGKHLGGAPLNFAYISSLLGERALIASRVGNDELGREITRELSDRNLDVSALQSDSKLRTGVVEVSFHDSQPRYDICQPVAWDALEWSAGWKQLAIEADAVCFGTLAQRSVKSRATILQFLKNTRKECLRVFDINLRRPFYNPESIEAAMQFTTILKMNDVELREIVQMFGIQKADPQALIADLQNKFKLDAVFVTCGERGALAVDRRRTADHPGFRVSVVDTVGAGDAFTAAATYGLLNKMELPQTLALANRWAAWVASQAGGMPVLDENAELRLRVQSV